MIAIENKKACVYTAEVGEMSPIVLRAGMNTVSESDYEKLKAHPGFLRKSELGWFEVLENETFEDITADAKKYKGYIKSLYNVEELKRIVKEDDRKDVVKVAQAQLDTINNQPKKSTDVTKLDNKDPYENV